LHILVIPSWYPSPISPISGIFAKQQLEALARRGHQIGVISSILSRTGFPSLEEKISQPEYTLMQGSFRNRFPLLFGSTGYFWVKNGYEMYAEYVKNYGTPDLIHAHSSLYAGVLAAKINKAHHIPYVLTEHSSYVTRKDISSWNVPRVKRAFLRANINIAVSNFVKEEIVRKYVISPENWRVIPNMVGSHFFERTPTPLAGENFIFTNIGGLVDVKAQNVLLEALAICTNDHHSTIKLRIIGDGPNREQLKAQSKDLGIERHVEWIQQVEPHSLPDVIANSQVIISSSSTETFGLTLAESLAVGRPVLSTNSGGPADIITDEVGIMVEKNDPVKLADAMKEMVKNIGKYPIDALKRYAQENFHEQVVMEQIEDCYQTALDGGNRT